ncbi:MAG TPA: hypothetical protein VFE47_02635, partial [Tepidisphaeraceae bacterium]|nr:hypothetical protein [Tepidisphaeraceae bacterium]
MPADDTKGTASPETTAPARVTERAKPSGLLARLDGCGGVVVAYTGDAKKIMTAGDQDVRLWDAATFQPLTRPMHHGKRISSAVASMDGSRILTFGHYADGKTEHHGSGAKVWDTKTGEVLLSVPAHGSRSVFEAAMSSDGSLCATCAEQDAVVRVWDTAKQKQIRQVQLGAPAQFVVFSPDASALLTVCQEGAQRWNLHTGVQIGKTLPASVDRSSGMQRPAAFSADGKILVIASAGIFRVYNAATGAKITDNYQDASYDPYHQFVSVGVSADGKNIATLDNLSGRIWDANADALTMPHPSTLAIISADGKRALLVALARSPATNSTDMPGIPLTHLPFAPHPLKWVSVETIVLRPCRLDMPDEQFARRPGLSPQISLTERAVEHLCLVQPRGMDRRLSRTPPAVSLLKVVGGQGGGVAGVSVLDQKDALEPTMPPPKALQGLDVVSGVFDRRAQRHHSSAMNRQER